MRKHARHNPVQRTRHARARRGVAMLLVLVALSTATILTVSYVGSRDITHAIAGNVKNAVDAHWAAASGASFAIAVLQTGADWSDADPTEMLKRHFGPGVEVLVTVTDLNGDPADANDQDLIVTTTATVGGVTSSLTHNVTRQISEDPAQGVDPELKEFAVYTKTSLTLDSSATVRSWTTSPAHSSGRPVKFGVGFVNSGDLSVNSSSGIPNAALYVGPDASASLRAAIDGGRYVGGGVMPYVIPTMTPNVPGSLTGLSLLAIVGHLLPLSYSGSSSTPIFDTSAKWGDISVSNSAAATFSSGDYAFGDVTITKSGVFRIDGDVRIYIRGNLSVTDLGAIELANNNCSLKIYLDGSLYMENAGVGVARSLARNSNRTIDNMTNYRDPARVSVYMTGASSITIHQKAVLFGTIYAPRCAFDVRTGGFIVGRVAANTVRVRNDSGIYYDLAMDNGLGFTNLSGPLYTGGGEAIKPLYDALATINVSLGFDGLLSAATTALANYTPPPTSDDDGVTYRDPDKAIARLWPVSIFALETYEAYTPPVIVAKKGDTGDPDGATLSPELAEAGESTGVIEK